MIVCFFFALFGLAFGSFLNVCIVRLPVGESVAWPRSQCRQCDRPIAGSDNIPVLSWLFLGAACRSCGGRISWVYPAVEVTTAALFVLCCQQAPTILLAAGWALLCFLLIGLAVMDAQTLLLPDLFTLPGLAAGILFAALRPWFTNGTWAWRTALHSAGRALLAAVLAAAVLLTIAGLYWLLRRRAGMGMGDVKLLAMLGAWLGIGQTALVLFMAVVAGALYGVGLMIASRNNDDQEESAALLPIPFGTMLSLAGIYAIFLGEGTLNRYLQLFR